MTQANNHASRKRDLASTEPMAGEENSQAKKVCPPAPYSKREANSSMKNLVNSAILNDLSQPLTLSALEELDSISMDSGETLSPSSSNDGTSIGGTPRTPGFSTSRVSLFQQPANASTAEMHTIKNLGSKKS